MPLSDLVLRVSVALVLGALIGAERQWRQRRAGLRTNTLVSVGSALFVTISASVTGGEVDPTRVAAQVVSGIGFLGAGVILREGLNIRGLNTAATLWCSAAVGSLSGSGLLIHATIGTAAILLANLGLRSLAIGINRQPVEDVEGEASYRVSITCRREDQVHVRAMMLQAAYANQIAVRRLSSAASRQDEAQVVVSGFLVGTRDERRIEQALRRLTVQPEVRSISWEAVDSDQAHA